MKHEARPLRRLLAQVLIGLSVVFGFVFRVSSFRVPNFGFRAFGFGFQVSGLGCRMCLHGGRVLLVISVLGCMHGVPDRVGSHHCVVVIKVVTRKGFKLVIKVVFRCDQ